METSMDVILLSFLSDQKAIYFIIFLTFLLRALPAILGIRPESSDEYYHLLCAETIRQNKFKYPKKIKGLPFTDYVYPPLFHYFLAIFPKNIREGIAPIISSIIDSIHVIVIYMFILHTLQGYFDWNELLLVANTSALLFAISPALLYYGVGPRAFNATARTVGELFVSLSFLLAVSFCIHGNYVFFILSCLFASLTFLTSKFGGQVLVFSYIILSIYDLVFIKIIILGLVLALILSKAHYVRVFLGWIRHLNTYRKCIQKKNITLKFRNDLKVVNDIILDIKNKEFVKLFKDIGKLLINNTYVILIYRNALLVIILYFFVKNYEEILVKFEFLIILFYWVIISIILFVITSLRPFLFLGEAERYLEYSVQVQSIIASILFIEKYINYKLLEIIIFYCIFVYMHTLIILTYLKMTGKDYAKDKKELFNWINTQKITGSLFISIPNGSECFEIPYKTENNVLYPSLLSCEEFEEIYSYYPYPTTQLSKIVNKYNVDYIITSKQGLNFTKDIGIDYAELNCYKKIFENENFIVYNTNI